MALTPGTLQVTTHTSTDITVEVVGAESADPGLHSAPYRFRHRVPPDAIPAWNAYQVSPVYQLTGLLPGVTYEFEAMVRTAAPIEIAGPPTIEVTTLTEGESSGVVDFFDDFGRADGPLGAPWESSNLVIAGGQVTAPDDTGKALVDIEGHSNYKVSATVNQRMWPTLIFRARDVNLYYALRWSSPDYELISYDNGTMTVLQTVPTPGNLNATMWASIGEVTGGTQITWGLDSSVGVNVTSATYVDSRPTRPLGFTKVGIQGQNERFWDNFRVEKVSPPGEPTVSLPTAVTVGSTGHLGHHQTLHSLFSVGSPTVSAGNSGHLADHVALKSLYDAQNETSLPTVTDAVSHATVHNQLHTWANSQGTELPPGTAVWEAKINNAPVGRTSSATISQIFGPTFATGNDVIANSEVVNDGGTKVLRQHIPANTLGSLIASPKLPSRVDDATLTFDVRFDPGFVWRHGLKVGAGLVGIRPGAGIYDPTSGQSRDNGCSMRIMVHGNDGTGRPFQGTLGPLPAGKDNEIVTYLYVRSPNTGFNGFGYHRGLGSFTKGVWHNVKMRGKLNTPGQINGVFQIWIDGDLRWEATDFDFRGNNSQILWDAVLWDTHRGGGPSPNWLSDRDDYLDLKNVIVEV